MPAMTPESGVIKNYLDLVLALPWQEKTEENLDLAQAQTVLEADHYGLEEVKERILEHLAVKALVGQRQRLYFVPGRASRRWKNFHCQIYCPRCGAQICTRFIGRCAGRGRNPRAPENLYRRHAGTDYQRCEAGGNEKSINFVGRD